MTIDNKIKNPFFGLNPEGKSFDELTDLLGVPCQTEKYVDSNVSALRIWRQGERGEYYIILLFNNNDKCSEIFDEGIDPKYA